MNNEFKDYYKMLGVTYNASLESIRKAAEREYRDAPDWLKNEINKAYKILSNYESRRTYDLEFMSKLNIDEITFKNSQTYFDIENINISPVDTSVEEPVRDVTEQQPVDESPTYEESVQQPTTTEGQTQEASSPSEPTSEVPVVEGPTQEEPTIEQATVPTLAEDEDIKKTREARENIEQIKESNKKKVIKNTLIIAGSNIVLGPVGGIVAAVILGKKGNLKLQKVPKLCIMKDISNEECKLIDQYNEKLEKQIDELLSKPLLNEQSNYELELARLKYENQLKLLEERIKFKKAQAAKIGSKAQSRLEILALELRFKAAIKKLEIQKNLAAEKISKLGAYSPNPEKTDKLTDIYEDMQEIKIDLDDPELSMHQQNKKKFEFKKLNSKRLKEINKMKLNKNGIARKQLLLAIIAQKGEVEEHTRHR